VREERFFAVKELRCIGFGEDWRVRLGTFLGLPLSHTNSCGRIRWGGRHGWGTEGFEPLNRTAALSGPMRRFTEA